MKEKRKYQRYNTEMKVFFQVTYDIRTKVEFEVIDKSKTKTVHKYSGVSENISAEGLRFVSRKQLNSGDLLLVEIYTPKTNKPVAMEAQVCWSRKFSNAQKRKESFRTGVKLVKVGGKLIKNSIHFDKKYHVLWSKALDDVFGGFAAMTRHQKKTKK